MKVKIGNHKSCLYQWDTGQFVVIDGAEQCNEIHFCNDRSKNALVVKITDQDGKRIANIPNILLQNDGSIYAYLFARNEDGSETRTSASFPVRGRKKPENYVYTETERWTYDNIERRLDDLEDSMTHGAVKSINGLIPDANGNVEIEIPEGITGSGVIVSETAPEDTSVLWIDTDDNEADNLQAAIDDALTQAKASGEFKGDPGIGIRGVTLDGVTANTVGKEYQINFKMSDGKSHTVEFIAPQGEKGDTGDDYVLTDADKTEIAEQAAGMVEVPESSGNVREYGATGDGVTDDTAAIAAAVADLGAGETLYFPKGVYRVSAVQLKSNMKVQGDGWCSVIKLVDNAPDSYTNCLDIEGKENVIIRDIKLDGNRWADGGYKQASTGDSKDYRLNGIRIRTSSNIRIENVWMHNNGYHGCVMTKSENVVIDRCRVTDSGFRPIHGNTQVYNCQITNCVCENNGIGLQGGSGALNDSIFFFGVRDLVISNNIIKSNRRGCITVGTDQDGMAEDDLTESGNITIAGNVCECYADLPYVASADSDTGVAKHPSMGICVYGSSKYKLESVTVTGNTILRANRAFYLYSQEAGTLATIHAAVTGNTVKDCSTGIYAQDVSGVVCSGNQFRGLAVNWIYGNKIEDCQFGENMVYAPGINQVCRIYNSKNVVLQSNNIIGDKAYAIYLPASNIGCIVMNNIMHGFTLDNPILNPNGHMSHNVPGSEMPTDDHINDLIDTAIDNLEIPQGGGGEVWEYIGEFNVGDSDVEEWIITEDAEEEPIELKKMYFNMTVQPSTATTDNTPLLVGNPAYKKPFATNVCYASMGAGIRTSKNIVTLSVEYIPTGDTHEILAHYGASTYNVTWTRGRSPEGSDMLKNCIGGLAVQTGNTAKGKIGAGSTVKIWGVRM